MYPMYSYALQQDYMEKKQYSKCDTVVRFKKESKWYKKLIPEHLFWSAILGFLNLAAWFKLSRMLFSRMRHSTESILLWKFCISCVLTRLFVISWCDKLCFDSDLIMTQASFQQLASHVVFAWLNVNVSQQQPTLLKLFGIDDVPVHLGYALQLVTCSRGLFQDHVGCGHGQQGRDMIFLESR